MSSRRRRGAGLFLYVEDTVSGLRKEKPISFDSGERGVERMQLEHVRSDDHRLLGYVLRDGKNRPQPEPRSSNRFDPASITPDEMRANAGLMGRSRTVELCEQQRLARVHLNTGKILPAEDFVERTKNKIAAYHHSANFHAGDKAVRIYPKSVSAPC